MIEVFFQFLFHFFLVARYLRLSDYLKSMHYAKQHKYTRIFVCPFVMLFRFVSFRFFLSLQIRIIPLLSMSIGKLLVFLLKL